ncbi:hypothetical protein EOPP23_19205 [Endozoicomonas sp. OPT23]|uniref:DUF2165 family protein n=1 Tax=Endozoicomonas sp. OPT23 TaxID=2072845 RepID=UPI00129AC11A|nr:DUF2165 domain-containing protein [Endozoicomonas sp. OPT23]MRI35097.1 hypothetical protein [Endozoicomonas sp. OPT23]
MNHIQAIRLSKVSLNITVAIFSTLVVFNNLVDYQSNFDFVKHVMSMDTTGNPAQTSWRAIDSETLWHSAYTLIIATEALITILCWLGVIELIRGMKVRNYSDFKGYAVYGLSLGICLWFLCFMGISGEWFLAWQSKSWNGIQPGFRISTVLLLILIYTTMDNDSLN